MMRKNLLIVGASSGIGFEIVKQLLKSNEVHVIAISRNIKEIKSWENTSNLTVESIDLCSPTLKLDMIKLLESFESLDYVINNAGKLVNKSFLELTQSDILTSYKVNILGVFELLQVAIPKMIERGGHIVNISSMGAFQGAMKFSGLSTYSSSKAALVNLTEMLAEEFNGSKIRVNCLCLGAVQTQMLSDAFPGYKAEILPEEMASYIIDFTLHASKYMNGKIIPVSLTTP